MKPTLKMLVAGLLCGAVVQTMAATTNLVQTINLSLTTYTESDTVTNGSVISRAVIKSKRTNKDLIQVLGEATTNSFSAKAKLLMITPLTEGEGAIIVQDGTNKVDVTGFFSGDDSDGVRAFQTNTVSHVEKETTYQIFRLRLRDRDDDKISVHFDMSGLSTVTSSSILRNKVAIGRGSQVSASLAGTGDFLEDDGSTEDMILQGTLTITGTTLQVTP